jgi:hypothetical protein
MDLVLFIMVAVGLVYKIKYSSINSQFHKPSDLEGFFCLHNLVFVDNYQYFLIKQGGIFK